MTLSIKNGEYSFLIRLDLMYTMTLWKEFQLSQILNDLSIRHLIKHLRYVWSVRFWLLVPEMNTSRKATEWLTCFAIVNLMLGCLLF